jgi:hypothetical protein
VKSFRTDVTGVVVRSSEPITRCVSVADTSLSLSLSLSTPNLSGLEPSFGAENGAPDHLLVGPRRASGCGICRSRRRPLAVSPWADVRVIELACSPNPWGTSEEVPSRAPTRAGFVGPRRRGLFHAWPRRPLLSGVSTEFAVLAKRVRFAISVKQVRISGRPISPAKRAGRDETSGSCAGSSVVGPSPTGLWRSRRLRRVLQHAPVAVVVSAERRDLTHAGSRRSPICVCLRQAGPASSSRRPTPHPKRCLGRGILSAAWDGMSPRRSLTGGGC